MIHRFDGRGNPIFNLSSWQPAPDTPVPARLPFDDPEHDAVVLLGRRCAAGLHDLSFNNLGGSRGACRYCRRKSAKLMRARRAKQKESQVR